MTKWIHKLDCKFYPDMQDNWDDLMLRDRILATLHPDAVVLDVGAGAGIVTQMDFRGYAAKICGIDLDPRVKHNPILDEGKLAHGTHIPYPDNHFDVAFADNVLEHLDNPTATFTEVRRVLKPGGVFLFKTPNRWHYMAAIASLTPLRFHQFVTRMRGRTATDTFPTRYRTNSVGAVCCHAHAAGLEVARLERVEGRPEYLRISWPTYLLGLAYERTVNSARLFGPFRIVLLGQLEKPK